MTITDKRKAQFSRQLLAPTQTKIGFADVGSGGPLKSPWNLLPIDRIEKFDFDPEALGDSGSLPICISNQAGEREFYVAHDPRSSSLHPSSPAFVERFGQDALLAKEKIQVKCITLDQCFINRYAVVDLMDVNAEGHDLQILQGATQLLSEAFVKCLKVEFELIEVWQEQGWFSDIDALLRGKHFELVHIDIETSRPRNARAIYHRGEPLWGKAIYVPSPLCWSQRASVIDAKVFADDLLKAIVLYTILDLPGRSLDLVNQFGNKIHNTHKVTSGIEAVFEYAKVEAIQQRFVAGLRSLLRR
ncbi:MAG: FkbM family methyltransferase [Chloroflexi bacterium]|nr:FkbM family methyltransferase [Chloroflexota bacterium]